MTEPAKDASIGNSATTALLQSRTFQKSSSLQESGPFQESGPHNSTDLVDHRRGRNINHASNWGRQTAEETKGSRQCQPSGEEVDLYRSADRRPHVSRLLVDPHPNQAAGADCRTEHLHGV